MKTKLFVFHNCPNHFLENCITLKIKSDKIFNKLFEFEESIIKDLKDF